MNEEIWRKRLSYVRHRLCLYPAPEPMPRTRKFWIATGLVTLAVICFSAFFISYMCARQSAFQTNAEDFGIMDQSIWNTAHGDVLHMTICNILGDTNCTSLAGTSRLAIHAEPILFPISLLYYVWSDPRVLFVLQTVIVALGAYPAFWLARLRLRNEWLAVAIAVFYLLYPAQLQATAYDFHAVTFTAAFLLFTLYFMYTRRTVWLFVFAILSMACKEEIPLVIATFGIWSVFFQRRWRSGLSLAVIGVLWFAIVYKVVMPHFSPTGQPLLISRYDGSGGGLLSEAVHQPVSFIRAHLWDSQHLAYLHFLFAPSGYIPKPHGGGIFYLVFLAPWILVMAVPSIAINMLSSNPQQYSGLFQYSAEIVPVIIFATIEALVVVRWALRSVIAEFARRRTLREQGEQRKGTVVRLAHSGLSSQTLPTVLISLLVLGAIGSSLRTNYYFHGVMPYSIGFEWPQTSAHTALEQHFFDMIPADASVSAQTKLVPHISHRKYIYLFPYADTNAEYVLLDVTGDVYPYFKSDQYIHEVNRVLASGQYGVVAAQDGYLLLKRGLPAPHILSAPTVSTSANVPSADLNSLTDLSSYSFALPPQFCSYIYASPQDVTNPLQVEFTQKGSGSMNLVGYNVGASSPFSRTNGYGTLTTYWRVDQPMKIPVQELILLKGSDGREYVTSTDIPDLSWCPAQTWKPGSIVRITSRTFNLNDLKTNAVPNGLAQMSIALLPQAQSSSTIGDVQARLALRILNAPGSVSANQMTNALQLMPLKIVN